MNPNAALQQQIEMYRSMTGEQRLAIALGLHQLACDMAREGIRRQHPHATASDVERLLQERIKMAGQRD